MTVDLVWLIVYILAARRAAGLLLEDDFGPLTDLRTFILSRWPGPDTRFLASEIVNADRMVADRYGETDWRTHSGLDVFWDVDDRVWYATFPHPIGSLWSCIRCMSVWTAAVGLLLWVLIPVAVWWAAALVLAVSEAIILLEGTDK